MVECCDFKLKCCHGSPPCRCKAQQWHNYVYLMQNMVYEVYHWYGMEDGHHTSAKHFQKIILHVPHFEPTHTKSICGLVRLWIFHFFLSIIAWCLDKDSDANLGSWMGRLRWIIHPHICRQFLWTNRT